MIEVSDVAFSFGATGRRVLDGVCLTVEPGEMVALLGSNGSGKSTLVQLLNGLLLPSAGTVTVDGLSSATPIDAEQIRRTLGVVFQHPDDQIVATSVEDDVAFGPENLGLERAQIRQRVDEALAAVGLTGFERREPHLLSGGQKQRLAIAGALAMRPRYLVLDEPTSMLDPLGRHEVSRVIAALREQGHGIVLITHDLAEAVVADRCVVLDKGRVVFEGLLADLVAHPSLGRWGLEVPPAFVLADRLAASGIDTDTPFPSVEPLVEALCR